MDSYTKTMNFLHQKLLQAKTKDQEDRIVNLMFAESQRKQTIKSFAKQNNTQSESKI
jgi:hypothetical protein|tara:strand:- start:668 stop:838 length:171 start_codon:yes stop_codon:yes gene_type:complete